MYNTVENQYVLPCSISYVHTLLLLLTAIVSELELVWCAVGKCRHDLRSTWPPAAMMT